MTKTISKFYSARCRSLFSSKLHGQVCNGIFHIAIFGDPFLTTRKYCVNKAIALSWRQHRQLEPSRINDKTSVQRLRICQYFHLLEIPSSTQNTCSNLSACSDTAEMTLSRKSPLLCIWWWLFSRIAHLTCQESGASF